MSTPLTAGRYCGRRPDGHTGRVYGLDGRPLPPWNRYMRKSPTGFEWGYGGSGPHQLAFALLMDVFLRNKELADIMGNVSVRDRVLRAVEAHHTLTRALVCCLPREWDLAPAALMSFLVIAIDDLATQPTNWGAWRDMIRRVGWLVEHKREGE